MPKKKTGARKKAEKQRERQKEIKNSKQMRNIVELPCNVQMVGLELLFPSLFFPSIFSLYLFLQEGFCVKLCSSFFRSVTSARCKRIFPVNFFSYLICIMYSDDQALCNCRPRTPRC